MAAFASRLPELQRLTESNDTKGLVSAINSVDGWKDLTSFTKWLSERANLSGKGAEATNAAAALNAFAALAENCIVVAEPYLCACLPIMLQAGGNKQAPVRSAAECAVSTTCRNMSANAARDVFKHLFHATEIENNWQTRVLALKMVASFGDHAPEQLGFALPRVI